MFLKLVSAVPGYIYSHEGNDIFVNLFIGSNTKIDLGNNSVQLKQETRYPWDGTVVLTVDPAKEGDFTLKVRIPGWAQSIENPYGLYKSNVTEPVELKVNGEPVQMNIVNGYAGISRKWAKGDKVELSLPMQPRLITANEAVNDLKGLATLASGPLVYCLEGADNNGLTDLKLDAQAPMSLQYQSDLLNGINVIAGKAVNKDNKEVSFTAIPYYAVGNRTTGDSYKVWIPLKN